MKITIGITGGHTVSLSSIVEPWIKESVTIEVLLTSKSLDVET